MIPEKWVCYRLSENIWVGEVVCKCGVCLGSSDLTFVHPGVVGLFEVLRYEWGSPIPISSGLRCLEYNTKIGGAKESYHLLGAALDLLLPVYEYHDRFRNSVTRIVHDGGVGWYPEKGICHIDVGHLLGAPKGRRWEG